MAKAKSEDVTSVLKIEVGEIRFNVLGKSPIILNAMSAKVAQGLLLPPVKKNAADKASSLKHDPIREFRDSAYKFLPTADSQTRIGIKALSFKAALRDVALDIPGAKKAEIGRLTYVPGDLLPLWGIPKLRMDVTRSADIGRTPDVRTRAIVAEWATQVSVRYTQPLLKKEAVVNLMAAAGELRGVGDWRPQKGSGTFGQFELVADGDERWQRIVAEGGREAQDAALQEPEPYDEETAALLSWFMSETLRRGFKTVA